VKKKLTTDHSAAIRNVLSAINNAWLVRRGPAMVEALNPNFSDDVVFRGPGFTLLGAGRDFAVQSYVDFVNQCEVKDCSLDEPAIDVIGETAIAQYKWKMTYSLAGKDYTEQGHDVFTLSLRDGQWRVIWRAMLPEPSN
jgi:hypothetical protein